MAPWMTVPRSRAPGGVSTGIERQQAQNVLGVDRVGIAQPVLDLGHRQPVGRAASGGFGSGRGAGFDLRRMIERARPGEILMAARQHGVPSFSPASAAMRCTKREVTVGAPAIFGGAGEMTSGAPSACAKSCADRPMRRSGRIEAEVAPHRPAQPRIAARLRRPAAFVQAAQHDAVDCLQARFQRAEDAHAHVVRFRPPHHAVADGAWNSSA